MTSDACSLCRIGCYCRPHHDPSATALEALARWERAFVDPLPPILRGVARDPWLDAYEGRTP